MIELEIGVILAILCVAFFFLGYMWNKIQINMQYSTLGSEEEDHQLAQLERQLHEIKMKETQNEKIIADLRQKVKDQSPNTDL